MTDAIISGLILGLALVFSVGPVVFTIIKLRINYGIKSAFYFIAGVWLSDIIIVLLANFFGEFMGRLIEPYLCLLRYYPFIHSQNYV